MAKLIAIIGAVLVAGVNPTPPTPDEIQTCVDECMAGDEDCLDPEGGWCPSETECALICAQPEED